MDIWTNPTSAPCSHTFCDSCINQSLRNKPECPLCKRSLMRRELTSMKMLKNVANEFHRLRLKAIQSDAGNSNVENTPTTQQKHKSFTTEELEKLYPTPEKPDKHISPTVDDDKTATHVPKRGRKRKSNLIKATDRNGPSCSTIGIRNGKASRAEQPHVSDSDRESNYELDGVNNKAKRRRKRSEPSCSKDVFVNSSDIEYDEEIAALEKKLEKKKSTLEEIDNALQDITNKGVKYLNFESHPVLAKALDYRNGEEVESSTSSSMQDDNYTSIISLSSHKRGRKRKSISNKAIYYVKTKDRSAQELNNEEEEEQNYVFCGSCLSEKETQDMKKMATKLGARVSNRFTPQVTHLIVGATNNNIARRTMKYSCAIICGVWILNYDWVKNCLESNRFVEEEPFEIIGDNFAQGGPKKGREAKMNNQSALLANLNIHIAGRFNINTPPKKEFVELCRWAGANIVTREQELQNSGNSVVVVVDQCETSARLRKKFRNIRPVAYKWLMDSISHYKILDCSTYHYGE
jgi:hypothetical protein